MACIRKRRGKYVADWRDSTGRRHWRTCATRQEADDVLSDGVRDSRQARRCAVDPRVTVAEYAQGWLREIAATVKPSSLRVYENCLRLHLLPTLGHRKVRQLHRKGIKTLLVEKLEEGMAREHVRLVHATLRAMLSPCLRAAVLCRRALTTSSAQAGCSGAAQGVGEDRSPAP